MQTVKLNLIPGSVLPVVNVSQYDTNRHFALQVYDGASTYDLTGKTVEIRGTKPDGNGFAYDAQDGVVSVSGNTVTISTTQQMTAIGGQTMAELRITSGDTILGTLNFVLMVEPSALSDDTPISDTDIPAIERDFQAALDEAEADALIAEGYAKGTQEGVPAQSGEPYYHDNAKYYKEEAESAASDVLEKYPKIVNDYWYIWDVDTNQYVNTGVRAKGTQGDPGEGVPAGGTTGQVLRKKSDDNYDTEWANGGGGASALDDLTDVNITSAANGQGLVYNGTTQKWENKTLLSPTAGLLRFTRPEAGLYTGGSSSYYVDLGDVYYRTVFELYCGRTDAAVHKYRISGRGVYAGSAPYMAIIDYNEDPLTNLRNPFKFYYAPNNHLIVRVESYCYLWLESHGLATGSMAILENGLPDGSIEIPVRNLAVDQYYAGDTFNYSMSLNYVHASLPNVRGGKFGFSTNHDSQTRITVPIKLDKRINFNTITGMTLTTRSSESTEANRTMLLTWPGYNSVSAIATTITPKFTGDAREIMIEFEFPQIDNMPTGSIVYIAGNQYYDVVQFT